MKFQIPNYSEPPIGEEVGTVAELFAGVGGFRLGLSRSNLKTIFSNQWEPSTKSQPASDCYQAHFGSDGHSNEDIAALVARNVVSQDGSVPRTDLLVGGFPCQDYSVAKSLNTSKGLDGTKGVLWWSIRDLVEMNEPPFIFLENVDRLLKSPASQKGRDFAIMLKTLGDLGYFIEWRVVNAADYGFPQRRIRVFIVARRVGSRGGLLDVEAQSKIYESGILARALPVLKGKTLLDEIRVEDSPEILTRKFGLGEKRSPFKNAGVYFDGRVFTTTVEANFNGPRFTLGDVLIEESSIPPEYWIDENRFSEWEFLKGAKSIQRIHKATGTPYSYSEGKMAFPDLLDRPSRTILTGEGGSSPSRFKHIINVDGRFRRLVPIELERLNGFPDDWTASSARGAIRDGRRAFFMGNALVVGLVEKVGQVLSEEIAGSR